MKFKVHIVIPKYSPITNDQKYQWRQTYDKSPKGGKFSSNFNDT